MSTKINVNDMNLEELNMLISNAKKEIDRKRKSEVRDMRNRWEKEASGIGMAPEEVFNFDRKSKGNRPIGEPRYQNPENPEQTWTGRGKRPDWFKKAEGKGVDRKDMEIKK